MTDRQLEDKLDRILRELDGIRAFANWILLFEMFTLAFLVTKSWNW